MRCKKVFENNGTVYFPDSVWRFVVVSLLGFILSVEWGVAGALQLRYAVLVSGDGGEG